MRFLVQIKTTGACTLREPGGVRPGEEVIGVSMDRGKTIIEFGPDEKSVKISSEFDLTIEPRSPNLIDIRTGGSEE